MIEPRYSLIIPAHNEASRIGRTLAGYLEAFADSEVLIVLNGCTDDTECVARQAAGSRENLRILRIEHAVGKGGAVRAGFLAAKASVVGYVDADGATPPEEMRRLFDSLRPGEDAVIASRWSKGAEVVIAQPMMRRLSSRVFNAVVRLLFGLPFHDTQCGAKVFTSASIRLISSSLEISNFAFDIDLLYGLRRAGSRIREVPTRWHDIDGSRINLPRASVEMLLAVLRLRLRHSLFRYIIPLFDRFLPTTTLRVRHGLAVLIVGLDDPESPLAGDNERYLFNIAASLVKHGHRVHWLSAGFKDSARDTVLDGITVERVGNRWSSRIAIPLSYVGKLRDRFDVIVEIQSGFPILTPLFSLKPKICLTTQQVDPLTGRVAAERRASFANVLPRSMTRALYRSSRFIALSAEHVVQLKAAGVEQSQIEIAFAKAPDQSEETDTHETAVRTFLDGVYAEVSRDHSSYVLSGAEWAIVPRRSRIGAPVGTSYRGRRAETLL